MIPNALTKYRAYTWAPCIVVRDEDERVGNVERLDQSEANDPRVNFFGVYGIPENSGSMWVADCQSAEVASYLTRLLTIARGHPETAACLSHAVIGDKRFDKWFHEPTFDSPSRQDAFDGYAGFYSYLGDVAGLIEEAVLAHEDGWQEYSFYETCDKVAEAIFAETALNTVEDVRPFLVPQ